MPLSREQSINLRAGQMVRTKLMPERVGKIARIIVPPDGERIVEIVVSIPMHEGFCMSRVYLAASEIERV